MNVGLLLVFTFIFTLFLLIIQRSEKKRRILVALTLAVAAEVMRRFAINIYGKIDPEALIAFVIAIVLNLLFYLLIGHYNPVGTGDDIQVIGMDD
ncbi:MAG: hypothetical protein H7175_00810 [Burkholderiales bacterium]|nr:hypothetical protein [Anaerolineae bacterium]